MVSIVYTESGVGSIVEIIKGVNTVHKLVHNISATGIRFDVDKLDTNAHANDFEGIKSLQDNIEILCKYISPFLCRQP